MMEMDSLDSAKCQKIQDLRTWMVLNESLIEKDKTWNSDLLQIERTKREKGAGDAVGMTFVF